MFQRAALEELIKWGDNPTHKPLIIRGARQVGKTTLVTQFANRFTHYVYLNLELPEDRKPFESFSTVDNLLQSIFFQKNKPLNLQLKNLIFIDEIQVVPEAINILRYLHEQAPQIHVIAAGSMLESLFNSEVHFPVGRVSYLMLRPASFPEFLSALGENAALEQLKNIPVQPFAHDKLLSLFHTYALIGGMPEIVAHYAAYRDLSALGPIYDALIASYMEDVEKYAVSSAQALHIRHVIEASYASAGKRIKFEQFGNSSYRSREMGEALRIVEKALLLHLIYPSTSVRLPLVQDKNKSPRLQLLDTGMLNYFVGLQKDIIGTSDLNDIYQGTVIEHLIGQEMLSFQYEALSALSFWVRDKPTSSAEVDYIYLFDGKLIPIEVKSGTEGRLRSLHQFMDLTPHTMAVRFYAGPLQLNQSTILTGKKYFLLNLPYYLASQLENYLAWLPTQIKS